MQAAIDAAALSLALEPANSSLAALQAKGEIVFAANYKGDPGGRPPLAVSRTGQHLNLSSSKPVPTSLMQLAGLSATTIGAATEVGFVTARLELALAIDNSGSMASDGKMAALKSAVSNLVTTLDQAAPSADFAKIAIVPFNSQVNVGTGYKNAGWLRYDTTVENPNFYGSSPAPPSSATWAGCLTDRNESYDASGVAPGAWQTNYVAANCEFPGLARTLLLSPDRTTVLNSVNAMTPNGATNVTIGVATAMAALRPDNPFGAGSLPSGPATHKFLIVFSDGLSTENRFRGNGIDGNPDVPQVEARLREACANAAAIPLQVYIVVLNSPDTSGVMRDCASAPSNYFKVTGSAQLQSAFDQIAKLIINQSIRLMR